MHEMNAFLKKLTFFILGKSLSYKKSTLQSDKDSEMASSLAVDGG